MKHIKLIKGFVLGLLIVLSGYYMIAISLLKGLLMLLLVGIGIYLLDLRQIERYLDVILRRIYVCVDFDTARQMLVELDHTLMIPLFKKEVTQGVNQLLAYLEGDFDTASQMPPPHAFGVARLNAWYYFVRANIDFERDGKIYPDHLRLAHQFYGKISKPLGIEVCMMERFDIKTDQMNLSDWMALRAEEQANLQFAELHYWLGKLTKETTKKAYYFKIAANLAPETYYGRSQYYESNGTNIGHH